LCLIITFFFITIILLIIELEFFANILILIYVGAVAILFLFINMMLDTSEDYLRNKNENLLSLIFNMIIILYLNINYIFSLIAIYNIPIEYVNNLTNSIYIEWFILIYTITTIDIFAEIIYTIYCDDILYAVLILFLALIGSIILTAKAQVHIQRQHTYEQISRKYKYNIIKII